MNRNIIIDNQERIVKRTKLPTHRLLTALLTALFSLTTFAQCGDGGDTEIGNRKTEFQEKLEQFENIVINLKEKLKIPALSVAVVKNGRLVYAKGLGYADPVKRIEATENTLYHIASITKTFTSTIIMMLHDKGLVEPNDPLSKYAISLPNDPAVRNLLSHTSNFTPGTVFYYNSSRYNYLGNVMQKITGRQFADLLNDYIINKLGLSHTMPNPNTGQESVSNAIAKPYKIEDGVAVLSQYPTSFSVSAGLLSTVTDLATYAVALDNNTLLSKHASEEAFTNFVSSAGDTLPYGLGWFVQREQGKKIVWHYGDWKCNSSLLLRIPTDSLVLVLLANTDGLSAPFFGLELTGDVTCSPFALEFLKLFVFNVNSQALLNSDSNTVKYKLLNASRPSVGMKYVLREYIALAEIDAETGNEKEYIDKLSVLYDVFPISDLSGYIGTYKTKSYTIKVIKHKRLLKAVFEENDRKKAAKNVNEKKEYWLFPEADNLFYMNSCKKIRFIDKDKGTIELMKPGQPETGKRIRR